MSRIQHYFTIFSAKRFVNVIFFPFLLSKHNTRSHSRVVTLNYTHIKDTFPLWKSLAHFFPAKTISSCVLYCRMCTCEMSLEMFLSCALCSWSSFALVNHYIVMRWSWVPFAVVNRRCERKIVFYWFFQLIWMHFGTFFFHHHSLRATFGGNFLEVLTNVM